MARFLWNILIWLDQGINVLFGWLFNLVLRPLYTFGDPDETLSSVFGKNSRSGTCKVCGWVCDLLHAIDPHHCHKNVEADEGDRLK
jgi:hypothetical protein